MTKKDYELLARALKTTKPTDDEGYLQFKQWEADVRAIAIMLSSQNARFNFNIFYEACGLELVKK